LALTAGRAQFRHDDAGAGLFVHRDGVLWTSQQAIGSATLSAHGDFHLGLEGIEEHPYA
jgi:hypothetical protein